MDLQKQTKNVNVVIRKNFSIPKDKLLNFLNSYCLQYAYIVHVEDVHPVTNIVEGIHYHIIMMLPKRKRLYTVLNDITEYFSFSNNHGIEIEVLKSLEGSIQYLIHKNDKDKTQHDISEIVTNIDEKELLTLLECENNSLTFDRIMYVIKNSNDLLDIIQSIGFTRYNMYRNTIKDMIDCYKSRLSRSKNCLDNGIIETIKANEKNTLTKEIKDKDLPF